MAGRRDKPEEIVTKLRQVEVLQGQGMSVAEAVRQIGEIFYTLREAQVVIEEWRRHYNTVRPHSALGWKPPAPEAIVPMDRTPVMH